MVEKVEEMVGIWVCPRIGGILGYYTTISWENDH